MAREGPSHVKETPKLLAGVAGIGLFVVLTVVLSRPDDARPVAGQEPPVSRRDAPVTRTGSAPGDRPFECPPLFVAARGSQGHWVAPVNDNGWFDLCDMPAGTYDLLLYSPSAPGAGYTLDGEGQLFGLLRADCRYSRFDLVLDWVAPLDAS